ncbi:MAG: hypothetical protein IPN82_05265 [Chitinophagaceae bacterium]|nr:hypothetical protein [Chitinophagaceae bacterium]
MKPILSEKNIVVVLFVMVLITFALAQEDTKKMEKGFSAITTQSASKLLYADQDAKIPASDFQIK